jgi:23S rRNA pseudouridine1911/1915/1917 synthase
MKSRFKRDAHFVAKETMEVALLLKEHFKIDPSQSQVLFELGAIYCNKTRLTSDKIIHPGDHLQIYLNPKRYPVGDVNWQSILVHEEKEFLVINKPGGIPVHSTDDNLTENVLSQLRKVSDQELWVTHRLDTAVSGLMVLAKNQKFQAEFNELLRTRKVSKFYRALVERKPAVGLVKHYMRPDEKLPKKLELEPQPGWLECSLEILNVSLWGSQDEKEFWEVEIELHTGRTHQIRAQISKIGSPILGDKLYRGRNRAGFTKSHLALNSSRLSWIDSRGKHQFEVEPGFKLL